MANGMLFISDCSDQSDVNGKPLSNKPRGISHFRKSVRDSFTTKGFLRIFGGFFLKTKGFLQKVYEIFWE